MTDLVDVTLPDGEVVTISKVPESWWTQNRASGYVDPKLLAPDPRQPREEMGNFELQELALSVKERGVSEPIVVTPRGLAPWVELEPEYVNLPFVVVSGHRRRKSALLGEVAAVPIRIRIYSTKQDYLLDASVLNKGRADLTPLEVGREIVTLRESGVTVEKIGKAFGLTPPTVYSRINLTRLTRPIQELLDPKVAKKDRLPVAVAGELGSVASPTVEEIAELHVLFKSEIHSASIHAGCIPKSDFYDLDEDGRRFEMQKILLAVLKSRQLSAARSMNFIHEHKLQLEAAQTNKGPKTDRFEPRKRKQIIANLANEVGGTTVIDWTPDEFRHIFDAASVEEVEKYRLMIHRAATLLSDVEELIKAVIKAKAPSSVSAARRRA